MPQITVKDANGVNQTIGVITNTGAANTANSSPVCPATDATFPVSGPLTDTQLRATAVQTNSTVSNVTTKFREAFESYPAGRWTQNVGNGDLVYLDGNAVAASYLVVSKSPLFESTETAIESVSTFELPVEGSFGLSISQRTLGQEFSLELVDTAPALPTPANIPILFLSQPGATTLVVETVSPHGLSVGRTIGISGCFDSRLNYPSVVVASTPSPTQFTVTAGPGTTLPTTQACFVNVLAATTAALPANAYSNGTSGVGATITGSVNGAFPDQDGVTIPLGGRILVKNEATAANNGVYVLTQVGSVSLPWILTRAPELDTTAELTVSGAAPNAISVHVAGGATQALQKWILSATVTTVGTTAVTFTQVPSGLGASNCFVFSRSRMGQAPNGVSQIFESATATNASYYLRSESGDAFPSGTVAGNHAATIGSTAPIQLAGALPYTYSFSPTTEFRMSVQADRTQFSDIGVDSVAASTNRLLRTQVCPDPATTYKLRIRANNNRSLTVPNVQIVNAVKSGATTATVTTDVAHGYAVGDQVVIYGSRDQTNFANLTAATVVASVVNSTTFTIVWGAAFTGSSRGGYVARVQGQNLLSALGAITQSVQSATLTTLADGQRQLTLIGNANWAGASISDLVELIGCRQDSVGTSLGVDGPWKVANISSTILTLVLPFSGQRTLPADFATTNAGGGLIRRTSLFFSYARIFDFKRERVEILPRPGTDIASATNVAVVNTPATTISSGSVTVSSGAITASVGTIGSYNGNDQVTSIRRVAADSLLARITIT